MIPMGLPFYLLFIVWLILSLTCGSEAVEQKEEANEAKHYTVTHPSPPPRPFRSLHNSFLNSQCLYPSIRRNSWLIWRHCVTCCVLPFCCSWIHIPLRTADLCDVTDICVTCRVLPFCCSWIHIPLILLVRRTADSCDITDICVTCWVLPFCCSWIYIPLILL